MKWRRDDMSLTQDSFTSANEYYSAVRKAMREKSNHNKVESQYTFLAIIFFTLVSPLFVTLGDGLLWGKLTPAACSVIAASATAWLQLRKPQRLWAMYRRAQRELEREKADHDFGLGQYANDADKESVLAAKVSGIAFRVHEQWEGLVPELDNLGSVVPSITPNRTAERT